MWPPVVTLLFRHAQFSAKQPYLLALKEHRAIIIHRNYSTKECRYNLPEHLSGPDSFDMGNQPAKEQKEQEEQKIQKEQYLVKVLPPVDPALAKWLARDLARIHGYAPKNPRAIEPPPHCVEYMRLYGWMDLDLDDPDLAHLFK